MSKKYTLMAFKLPVTFLTFSFFPKGQGGWHRYLSFLSRAHIYHPYVEALDHLPDAQHDPLRMSGFVCSTKTDRNHHNLSITGFHTNMKVKSDQMLSIRS